MENGVRICHLQIFLSFHVTCNLKVAGNNPGPHLSPVKFLTPNIEGKVKHGTGRRNLLTCVDISVGGNVD